MGMKQLFQDWLPQPLPLPPSSSEVANNASSSGSNVDQDLSTKRGMKTSSLLVCFPPGMDLNPVRVVVAEMVGTFILMFSVCGIIASTQLMRGEVGLAEYATTGALSIVVIVFAIGPISGSHVNPAVTLAFAAAGHFPWSKVVFYILAQLLGSILATYVGSEVYGVKPELMTTQPLQGRCSAAFWAELISTFILVFLATSLTCQAKSLGHLAGFVMGVAIGLAVLITGPVSGGSLNPARSLGPAIVAWRFNHVWIYITAPSIGAAAGVFLFRVLRLQGQPCPTSPSTETSLLG